MLVFASCDLANHQANHIALSWWEVTHCVVIHSVVRRPFSSGLFYTKI